MKVDIEALTGLVSSQLVQVTLVALVVAVLVRLFCRRRPHLAYMLLMVVVIKCVTPPLWSSPTGVFSWVTAAPSVSEHEVATTLTVSLPTHQEPDVSSSEPVPVKATAERSEPFRAIGVTPSIPERIEAVEAATIDPPSVAAAEALTKPYRFETMLLIVWAVGAVLLASAITLRGFLCEKMLWRTRMPVDDSVRRAVTELSRRVGVRRRVRVMATSAPFGPAVCGLWRPKLVLPQTLVSETSAHDLERILAHELIHIRRGDDIVSALQIIAQVLWWFHPLIWWTNREICREREHCCDEETIAGLSCDPHAYAQTLVDILKQRRQMRPLLAFATARSGGVTIKRLESIMDRRRGFRRRAPRGCWAVLVVGLALVLPGAGLGHSADTPPDTGDSLVATGAESPEAGNASSSNETVLSVSQDMAIVDDSRIGAIRFSPAGTAIAVSANDSSTARLYVAPYPAKALSDYRQVAELKNATCTNAGGSPAITWCRTDAQKLALIVQQNYEFVLHTVDRDGANLRRVCTLEGGPINGTRKGNLIDLVWPSDGEIYYYMEGRIVKVELGSGKADLLFEESERTQVRGVFLDQKNRLVTLETSSRKSDVTLLALDRAGRVVERSALRNREQLMFPVYNGGPLYVNSFSDPDAILVMQIGDEDPVGIIPDRLDGWMLRPLAMTPNERELVCSASKRVVVRDEENLPKKGTAIARLRYTGLPPEIRKRRLNNNHDREFTYSLEKLVRVPIPLENVPKSDAPRGEAGAAPATATPDPCDLSLVPDHAVVVWAIRPAALLRALDTAGLQNFAKQVRLHEDPNLLPLDKIEQLTVYSSLSPGSREVTVVRASTPNDVNSLIPADVKRMQYGGRDFYKYYRMAYVPVGDTSVVVCDLDDTATIKASLHGKPGRGPSWLSRAARHSVRAELGMIAVNHAAILALVNSKEAHTRLTPLPALQMFCEPPMDRVTTAAFGFGFSDRLEVRGFAGCQKIVDAIRVLHSLEMHQARARFMIEAGMAQIPDSAAIREALQGSLDSITFERAAANLHATGSMSLDDTWTTRLAVQRSSRPPLAFRMQSANQLKMLGTALHNYYDVKKRFPTPVLMGPDGKTPYSWRVAILPYLDRQELYDQYRFDEPWDGPNNRKLLEQMPFVFRHPSQPERSQNASYFALTGSETAFRPGKKTSFADIHDGASNTLMLVEAKREIPWTKPEDIPYDSSESLPDLRGFDKAGFHAVLLDGAVRFLSHTLPEKAIRGMITIDGREVVDWEAVAVTATAAQEERVAPKERPGSNGPVPLVQEEPGYANVIAVWPPEDGEEIEPVTEIRIRFDRPMDPEVAASNIKSI